MAPSSRHINVANEVLVLLTDGASFACSCAATCRQRCLASDTTGCLVTVGGSAQQFSSHPSLTLPRSRAHCRCEANIKIAASSVPFARVSDLVEVCAIVHSMLFSENGAARDMARVI